MELLTEELKKKLPPLYGQEHKGKDAIVHAKFFTPDSSWTWYVLEGEEQEDGDWIFFGMVDGFEREFGYFTLSELEGVRGALNLPVERDLFFGDHTIRDFL